MRVLFHLALRWLLFRLVPRESAPRRRGKDPTDYTDADVRALSKDSPLFCAIAMYHPNGDTAALAAERIREDSRLHILALTQEAQLFARIVAARRLKHDQDLMVELAIRDDDPGLAVFAARLVESAAHVPRLQKSKYETVRLVGLLKERDPLAIEKILDDPNPTIRGKARDRLRELRAN